MRSIVLKRSSLNTLTSTTCAALAGLCLFLSTGCQLLTNPFRDEFSGRPPTTTSSVDGVHAAAVNPMVHDRGLATVTTGPVDGSVTHGPLLFEDGFEDTWTADDSFAVDGCDFVQWVAWRGRFAVNLVAVGGSMIVTPPWQVMVSDGSPSRRILCESYDAGVQ